MASNSTHKVIVIAAPSGAGKTTIVHHLLKHFEQLAFSVSATTREKRHYEQDGADYYFLPKNEFRQRVVAGDFLEWEEVYKDQCYGTLKSEVQRIWKQNKVVIFDVDVKGAANIKAYYGEQALSVFIKTPSLDDLLARLKNRKTETEETLKKRIEKASEEISWASQFDCILVNDQLDEALKEAEDIVGAFLK